MKTSKDAPQLCNTEEGQNIYYRNKYLYPLKNSLNRIKNKIDSLSIIEGTLIIIPSPLLFYGIDYLIEVLPKNCFILMIEHDKELFSITENKLPGFPYLFADSFNDLNIFINNFNLSDIRKLLILPLNNGYFLNRNFYSSCYDIFQKRLNQYWKNRITLLTLGSRWFKNIFYNLMNYRESISSLKIEGAVVVAGAGESIEKTIPLLKKYRKYFTLIAIDTALSTLHCCSLKPDFILAVESQFYNIYDFHNYLDSGIPVICDLTAYPQTCRITGGMNYYFISEFCSSGFLASMNKKTLLPPMIPPLGSVGVTAVYIASLLTSSCVLYTGLDFSYIPGKSHSKNSPFIINTSLLKKRIKGDENYSFCINNQTQEVYDINGIKCLTNPNLRSYSDNLKMIIKDKSIYALLSSGITENSRIIRNETDFAEILEKCPVKSVVTQEYENKIDLSALNQFFKDEYEKITSVILSSLDYLNGRTSEENINSKLKELLAESDYITADFTDSTLPVTFTPAYIKRILLSCYRYERILKNILK